jgi:hypothetical protein
MCAQMISRDLIPSWFHVENPPSDPESREPDRQRDLLRRSFFAMATHKRPVLDLDAEAQAALDEARAISQGPERAAAMKKAGILRKAADSHGIIYAKRGRPTKT